MKGIFMENLTTKKVEVTAISIGGGSDGRNRVVEQSIAVIEKVVEMVAAVDVIVVENNGRKEGRRGGWCRVVLDTPWDVR